MLEKEEQSVSQMNKHLLVPIPGDSGQTPTRSICLKFAGPTIRTIRHLLRSFLESRIQLISQWLPVVVYFAAYMSTRNFTCLRGFHLLSYWLDSNRTLTQFNHLPIFRMAPSKSSHNRKDGNSHRHVTGRCRHVMGKHCHYENSCTTHQYKKKQTETIEC